MQLRSPLSNIDPRLSRYVNPEGSSEERSITLLPWENVTPRSVQEALASDSPCSYTRTVQLSPLSSIPWFGKYKDINDILALCKERALRTFGLAADEWGVEFINDVSESGLLLATSLALLAPHDPILVPSSHDARRRNASQGIVADWPKGLFHTIPYHAGSEDSEPSFSDLTKDLRFLLEHTSPCLVVAGDARSPLLPSYAAIRQALNDAGLAGTLLLASIHYTSGLVAANLTESPFASADIVTANTVGLRGPPGNLLFYRRASLHQTRVLRAGKDTKHTITSMIRIFQGSYSANFLAALSVAFELAQEPQFKIYQQQVLMNGAALATQLCSEGLDVLQSHEGGPVHLLQLDVFSKAHKGVTGHKIQKLCESVHLYVDKHPVPREPVTLNPHGILVGTAALTSRGATETDFATIGQFLGRAVRLVEHLCAATGARQLKDFINDLTHPATRPFDVDMLANDVRNFAEAFPVVTTSPGVRSNQVMGVDLPCASFPSQSYTPIEER